MMDALLIRADGGKVLGPEDGVALEEHCRAEFTQGQVGETVARLMQGRALYRLTDTMCAHPMTGEVVPLWRVCDGDYSWSGYCESELGVGRGRASWLRSLWETWVVRLEKSTDELQDVPMSKLRDSLGVVKRSLVEGAVDEEIVGMVLDGEVSCRELAEACRERRGEPVYRVWFGAWRRGEDNDLRREIILSAPGGEIVFGCMEVFRPAGMTDGEWEYAMEWGRASGAG